MWGLTRIDAPNKDGRGLGDARNTWFNVLGSAADQNSVEEAIVPTRSGLSKQNEERLNIIHWFGETLLI
jgi:hypothetical protein